MDYSVKIYSRIGELMQGVLSNDQSFMVSGFSSEHWYSEAWLEEEDGEKTEPLPPKAGRALRLLLETTGARLQDKRVCLQSNIPQGKGLSSSSTDILGVLSVVNDYLDAGLSTEQLYGLASQVEPTDPCLSGHIHVFYQQTGIIGRPIGLPPMDLLYFDTAPGRRIDTEQLVRPRNPGAGKFFGWLLDSFLVAAEAGDHPRLFDCITASAEYNQMTVSLPRFADYYRLARETGAGLMVAHSGTIAGLLTRPGEGAALRQRLEKMAGVPVYSEHYSPLCEPR
jgi:L-threonine kinase